MLPVDFEGANFTFTKPEGMTDEQCMSLKVYRGPDGRGNPIILTAWRHNKEDLEALNNGGNLWISISGTGMPPIGVFTMDEIGNVNE